MGREQIFSEEGPENESGPLVSILLNGEAPQIDVKDSKRLPGTVEDMEERAEEGKQFDNSTKVKIAGREHDTHIFSIERKKSLLLTYPHHHSIAYVVGDLAYYTN